jgi:hypothetical protein
VLAIRLDPRLRSELVRFFAPYRQARDVACVVFALPHHRDDCTLADTDVLNGCLVAEPVPSWQRVL